VLAALTLAFAAVSCDGGARKSSGGTDSTGAKTTGGTSTTTSDTSTGETGPTGTTGSGTTTSGGTATEPGTTGTGPGPSPPPSPGKHGRPFLIGTVDDAFQQPYRPVASRLIGVAHRAGFNALVVSIVWRRGRTKPSRKEIHALRGVAAGARRHHMQPFLLVWNGYQNNTPATEHDRKQFAKFTAATAHKVHAFRDFIIGNEPNLNTFWMPQFGPKGGDVAARDYFDLLARSYDALKDVSPKIRVVGGTLAARGVDRPGTGRDTHSPTRFIRDLGHEYESTGRSKPIMDALAMHPYPGHSRIPPNVRHTTSRAITLADYPKLVHLLADAFDGTPQRGDGLPIFYTEFGVETPVPPGKRRFYTNFDAPDAADVVSPAVQARYYRLAFQIAYCQPQVEGLFIFHTYDERDLQGWQSGLYYADQTRKPSLASFRHIAAAVRDGTIADCGSG
jgi:hypothetical protein